MNKNYRKKNGSSSAGMFKQASIALVSVVIGYLAAIICDVNTFKIWFAEHVLATPMKPTQMAVAQPDLPKPKLEFYTLLTKEKVVDAPSEVAAVSAPAPKAELAVKEKAPVELELAKKEPAPSIIEEKKPAVVSPPSETIEKTPVLAASNKNTFVLQIAAFKNMRDAERLRATLVMKGFDVNIASVNQSGGSWYRVMMGPFPTRLDAEKAQLTMAKRERITGMIRKMDV